MASESAESESVSVDLPAELAEWVRQRAAELDVTPDTLVLELLSSYRTTAALAVDLDGEAVEVDLGESAALEAVLEPVLKAAVGATPQTNGAAPVDSDFFDRIEDLAAEAARDAVATESAASAERVEAVEAGLAALEDDVADKIDDVRARVIEVKREADAKAPADHDHEAVEAVAHRVKSLEDEVEALTDRVSEGEAGGAPERLEAVEADLADVEDRLRTVAWIVRDLREAQEAAADDTALSELKREAAAADVSRATCESCGDGVEIGLLTEPACPHCEATVSTVEPGSGFFSSPTLRTASQLTAGDRE